MLWTAELIFVEDIQMLLNFAIIERGNFKMSDFADIEIGSEVSFKLNDLWKISQSGSF